MRPDRILLSTAVAAACWFGPVVGFAQTAPVSQNALPPAVDSAPLDAVDPGAVGLLPSQVTGLPSSLWRASDIGVLTPLIGAVDPAVPALQALMRTLMLAEADPPAGGGTPLLSARLDWLVKNGAVDETAALLDIVGYDDPALFSRWADLTLLIGRPVSACRAQAATPSLSDDVALRVFCIARSGDWNRAALVLQSARTLGSLSKRRAALLEQFLDPELAEDSPPLLPPVRPTPLEFRLFEALGEPLPTAPLPLAYSVLDLAGDNGWRAQIEAAERLARAGALPANRLLGLYSLKRPAASGGVWDRVAALQAFETALARGTPSAVGAALQRMWPQMASARLLTPMSELFADRLAETALEGRAARMAQRAAYLSSAYERLAPGTNPEADFLRAIARGEAPDITSSLPNANAVRAAFSGAQPPQVLQDMLSEGRLGEVILRAVALFSNGADGSERDLTDALATLRAVGLEDAARRAALQVMILTAERAL